MIFGTYIAPKRESIPPTGTEAIPSDYSVFLNLFRPFGKHKTVAVPKVNRQRRKAKRRANKA